MILNICFSIKLIRQFIGGKKNFRERQITEKYCFSKFRPLGITHSIKECNCINQLEIFFFYLKNCKTPVYNAAR
jgi:hypothetical protein